MMYNLHKPIVTCSQAGFKTCNHDEYDGFKFQNFAAGDYRSRTTKRVAFAVGDGALAVTRVHDFLGTYD